MDAAPGMGTAISPNEPFHLSLPPQVPPPGGLWGTPLPHTPWIRCMPCDASASALQNALRSAGPAPTPGRSFFAMESGGLPPDSGGSPRCRGERPLALALGMSALLLDGRMDAVLGMGTAISPNGPFHLSLSPLRSPHRGDCGGLHSPTPPGYDAWEAQSRLDCWSSWPTSRNTSPIIGFGWGLRGTPCPLRSVEHSPTPPEYDAWEAQSRLDCWSSWPASRNTSAIIDLAWGMRGLAKIITGSV